MKYSCEYIRKRSKKYKAYFYCKYHRHIISYGECESCLNFNLKTNKGIKKQSAKQKKKEKSRYSILQSNNNECFLCKMQFEKLDTHEAFGGANRSKSIEWGLIYYLCRKCHQEADLEKNIKDFLHNYARQKFVEKYGSEKFLEEFGKNYY